MAYTAAQLQALQDALASGELTVEFDGKRVTYRSIAELKAAIAVVEDALAAAGEVTAPTRVSYASLSKD